MSEPPPGTAPGKDSASAAAAAKEKTWKVGTLVYTKFGLISIFTWTLWGDLVFTLSERIYPSAMPYQLERLHIPQWCIPILMGFLGQTVALPMNPYLSFRSDRYRSRWGRRIPYIFKTLLPVAICMSFLGFSDDIGAYLRNAGWVARLGISQTTAIILVMGILILAFDYANIFINTIYWYLFADVIPRELMGRFFSLFRIVGMVAGSFFSFFLQKYIETQTKYLYLGAAAVYLFGFGIMCWRVKEGGYPPPTDMGPRAAWYVRFGRMAKVYVKECFRHPVHISLYASQTFVAVSGAALFGLGFYYRQYLHISQDQMGKFGGVFVWTSILLAFPLGWVVDKIHPVRATLIAMAVVIPINVCGFYMDSFLFYMIFTAVRSPFTQLGDAAGMPLYVALFPRKQYGQFASANGMVRSLSMLMATVAAGFFINFFTSRLGIKGDIYGFFWLASIQIMALGCFYATYLYWKKYGAENFSYDPELDVPGEVVLAPVEQATTDPGNPLNQTIATENQEEANVRIATRVGDEKAGK